MTVRLPILVGPGSRPIAWRKGRAVALEEFAAHVAGFASRLPHAGEMIDLCEDRYAFIAAYAAALTRGHAVLLPPSRVDAIVAEVQRSRSQSYRVHDAEVEAVDRAAAGVSHERFELANDAIAMFGYTSGSTGQPQGHPKRWGSVHASSARNAAAIRAAIGAPEERTLWIVATVPSQHMYGMELSVLLPMLNRMAVHAARPFFPADVARALAEVPGDRVLVSTPVHLRALVESDQRFPPIAAVISATAPLDQALARAVEDKFAAPLLEMFGSTETCVIATRRTANEQTWRAYEGVTLESRADDTLVSAPWFVEPIALQDVIELRGSNEFVVLGRNADMVEVAGKRASLADLTRRLRAIEGVQDAVVFQPDAAPSGTVRRVAALAVAPTRTVREILDALSTTIDPAFVPRPLVLVDELPRNEVGKLPRERLMELLRERSRAIDS